MSRDRHGRDTLFVCPTPCDGPGSQGADFEVLGARSIWLPRGKVSRFHIPPEPDAAACPRAGLAPEDGKKAASITLAWYLAAFPTSYWQSRTRAERLSGSRRAPTAKRRHTISVAISRDAITATQPGSAAHRKPILATRGHRLGFVSPDRRQGPLPCRGKSSGCDQSSRTASTVR